MINKEEFEVWRSDPVTKFVFQLLESEIPRAHDLWMSKSWVDQELDPAFLAELKGRVSAITALLNLDYEQIEEELNEQPQRDISH